jgi:hypothetical protein
MWRNADVLDFVGWLREHNDEQSFPGRKAGFYGLDLYSLHASIEAVLAYLDKGRSGRGEARPASLQLLRTFREGGPDLRYAAAWGSARTCEDAVVQEPDRASPPGIEYLQRDGQVAADAYFARNKTPRGSERGGILSQYVSARSFVLEPARQPHDGGSGVVRRASRQRAGCASQDRRLGAQFPISATPAPPRWVSAAN